MTEHWRPSLTGGPTGWDLVGMVGGIILVTMGPVPGGARRRHELEPGLAVNETQHVEPMIQFQNAGVSLGGRPVLRGVDLVIAPGESVGVAGPNGSGKTTLVRAAATLLTLDEGSLSLMGAPVTGSDLVALRRRIGLIGHQPTLIPELSLSENLVHVARLSGVDESRVERSLEVVGLAEAAGRRADACSFGMRRRVEIAHLLLRRPSLLLFDEAASGLDESARSLVDTLVASVCRRGGGCLIVSHDRAQLSELASRVLTLSGGRLGPAH